MRTDEDIPFLHQLRNELVRAVRRQSMQSVANRMPHRRRAAFLAGAGVLTAAIGLSAFLLVGPQTESGGRGEVRASCVQQFSLQSLRERDFAFDGVIEEVVVHDDSEDNSFTEVTFRIIHWYKGGSGEKATRRTSAPPGVETSAGSVPLTIGSRILAAGDDQNLWACGFSMPYSDENAELYAEAFA